MLRQPDHADPVLIELLLPAEVGVADREVFGEIRSVDFVAVALATLFSVIPPSSFAIQSSATSFAVTYPV